MNYCCSYYCDDDDDDDDDHFLLLLRLVLLESMRLLTKPVISMWAVLNIEYRAPYCLMRDCEPGVESYNSMPLSVQAPKYPRVAGIAASLQCEKG